MASTAVHMEAFLRTFPFIDQAHMALLKARRGEPRGGTGQGTKERRRRKGRPRDKQQADAIDEKSRAEVQGMTMGEKTKKEEEEKKKEVEKKKVLVEQEEEEKGRGGAGGTVPRRSKAGPRAPTRGERAQAGAKQ
ncbi:hypothetical protein PTSG_13081 [Salpingoeca rosetta]|uniref:Uncharacterized protein n=1 Tax=Salpingoeca rosetta (strain ATCC 50818 / BSB-021) TaxID=946362 RepID=F2URY9_SALR5|nr:uncharacterized protein PTSG_13081 [Salpingoeca rosetta]EGD80394.1 hypothetical protein PTSG_13081 [Salpingoeca rosetta]|eukprot:XP_004988184.1 hypothetical protein PTSG_13081 [Salpingoeca rosetta]